MVTCPNCGQSDSVQKVSALYDSQTHRGSTYVPAPGAWGGWYPTTTRSDLARRLSPPRKQGWHWFAWLITLIFVADGLLLLAMTTQAGPETGVTAGQAAGIGGTGLVLLAIGGVPLILHLVSDGRRQAQWQSRMAQWNRQWFCHRCDGVFDGAASPPQASSAPVPW